MFFLKVAYCLFPRMQLQGNKHCKSKMFAVSFLNEGINEREKLMHENGAGQTKCLCSFQKS